MSPRVLLAVILLLAGCSTAPSSSDYDSTAKFYSYTTFVVTDRQDGPLAAAIQAYLLSKGFELASTPARADFVVDYTLSSAGILSIDIVDQRTHRRVWHGWSKEPFSQHTVHDVLSWFPPGHSQ